MTEKYPFLEDLRYRLDKNIISKSNYFNFINVYNYLKELNIHLQTFNYTFYALDCDIIKFNFFLKHNWFCLEVNNNYYSLYRDNKVLLKTKNIDFLIESIKVIEEKTVYDFSDITLKFMQIISNILDPNLKREYTRFLENFNYQELENFSNVFLDIEKNFDSFIFNLTKASLYIDIEVFYQKNTASIYFYFNDSKNICNYHYLTSNNFIQDYNRIINFSNNYIGV